MSSVMPGLMSIVLFTLKRSFPSDIRGVGHWAAGSLIVSLAALLLAFRGAVPFWLSAVAANGMLILGLGLCNIGSEKFFGRPSSWRSLVVLLAVGVGGLVWMGLVQPDELGRAAVISAILAVLYGIQSHLLLRDGRHSIYCVALGAMFLIQSVSAAVRCITCFIPGWGNTDMFAHDTVQVVYLTVNGFMSLIITVGFVLVATDRLRAKLERQSLTDPLTGLLNRRAFSSIHETERERMMRESSPLAMLIVDLDHFKSINDKHGHDVGDRVLMDFADRVAGTLSPREHFARYGGEEFVILLPGVDADEAQAKAETIRRQVQDDTDRSLPTYTCSIGVACMKAADATLMRLHRVADEALYRAKSSGRNRVVVTDDLILL